LFWAWFGESRPEAVFLFGGRRRHGGKRVSTISGGGDRPPGEDRDTDRAAIQRQQATSVLMADRRSGGSQGARGGFAGPCGREGHAGDVRR